MIHDGSGSIEIDTVNGNATIEGESGELSVRNVTGNLEIEDGSGGVEVVDVGGNFTVGRKGSGHIDYERVSGRVSVPSRD